MIIFEPAPDFWACFAAYTSLALDLTKEDETLQEAGMTAGP